MLNYYSFEVVSSFSDKDFAPPSSLTCGDFPGPGATAHGSSRGALGIMESPELEAAAVAEHFGRFKDAYNKSYPSGAEERKRGHTFTHNKRFVETTNRRGLSYSLAVNHLADLDDSEMAAMRGSRSTPRATKGQDPTAAMKRNDTAAAFERPASVDWRKKGKMP